MDRELCPNCGEAEGRRSRRRGVTEQLLAFIFVFPFRCQECAYRFFLFRPGRHYVRVRKDRRDFERALVRFQAQYAGHGGDGQGTVTDLTISGCSLEVEGNAVTGTALELVLDLKDGGSPVKVEGHVEHRRPPSSVGLKFTRIAEADRVRIGKVVHPKT
jgi:hypothetical protein